MRLPLSLLAISCCIAATSFSQVLIKNTNVFDVEKKTILAGYDVVALDGKIISVDKGKMFKLPEGTQVIDGTGKYLVPGFVDAHVHFFQSGGLFARPDAIDLRKHRPYDQEIKWVHDNMEDFCRRYISAGITSVVDVGSTFNFLDQRDSFATKNWSPLISMTGPLLTTYVPAPYVNLGDDSPFIKMETEENTRAGVRSELKHKPDFIKIWYIVLDQNTEQGARKNLPLVQAAIDEAHKNNLRVAVHATERITAQLAVEAGADFLVHNIEDEVIGNEFVQLLKKKNVVLCPTVIVGGNYGKSFGDTYHFSTDELNVSNPFTSASIIDYPWPDTSIARRYTSRMLSSARVKQEKTTDSIIRVNLKKLLDGGVTIATGTDAGNIGTQHASSYFVELEAMQQSGFNAWQLLQSSTINGAKAVGKEKEWGSITKGKTANMVLLDANPLDGLGNWRKINAVINKGVPVDASAVVTKTPVMLAQQQLNAYNAHDLDAFLEPYAEDVKIYDFPDKLIMNGKAEMRKNYEFVTKTPKLYCKLLNRTVQGNMVVDHEEVWGFGEKPFYGLAIYIIEKGKISKVYFQQ
jgi:imidazolonepropionase-like amidohydrolase